MIKNFGKTLLISSEEGISESGKTLDSKSLSINL